MDPQAQGLVSKFYNSLISGVEEEKWCGALRIPTDYVGEQDRQLIVTFNWSNHAMEIYYNEQLKKASSFISCNGKETPTLSVNQNLGLSQDLAYTAASDLNII